MPLDWLINNLNALLLYAAIPDINSRQELPNT